MKRHASGYWYQFLLPRRITMNWRLIMEKWNFKLKKYEPYEVKKGWRVALWSDDMNLKINCANCGKEVKFGTTYTSMKIHNDFGLGYSVCSKCYEKEWKERELYE